MTTLPVVTITDELLAEIEAAAKIADPISTELYGDRYMRGHDYSRTDLSEPQDKYIRLLSVGNVLAMITELRTLRAQNAELALDAFVRAGYDTSEAMDAAIDAAMQEQAK